MKSRVDRASLTNAIRKSCLDCNVVRTSKANDWLPKPETVNEKLREPLGAKSRAIKPHTFSELSVEFVSVNTTPAGGFSEKANGSLRLTPTERYWISTFPIFATAPDQLNVVPARGKLFTSPGTTWTAKGKAV